MILGAGPSASVVSRIDPRVRLLLAAFIAVGLVAVQSIPLLALALAVNLLLSVAAYGSGIPWRRFVLLNILMGGLLATLPWSIPGAALAEAGDLSYSREGVIAVLRIALRANAIVLALTALAGTIEPVTMGHAFDRLRFPRKFTQLFLLTVRYIDVLESEYRQLRRAMAVRAFEPGFNRHTFHAMGNLVGMLLVRAVERSERIHDAMVCRAFSGRYPSVYEFRFGGRDAAFALGLGAVFVLIVAGDYWTRIQ